MPGPITKFIRHHYRHFNAAALRAAADDYIKHLDKGGKMLVTLAGAMSTAEIGLSLAEMIRQDKVHAISCTGANLEEDIFNLVAHDHYER
ncbi:MAG: deoxyhypusine synthase family protein, partial [Thermoanaerobaculia bacterium]